MALTLIEAAKRATGDVLRQGVIETFARSVGILGALPFDDIEGNALKYNQENTLPGIGFRGVNEAFAESTGVINPVVETLAIAGGDADVDKFIVQTMGADQRAAQVEMKVKAISQRWANVFIKGDSVADPKQFDGLQTRLTGSQLIDAGSASGGDALSLNKLDEVLDTVDAPTHLLMTKALRRLLTQASRNTSVGGFITFDQDEFGRQVSFYQGVPILIADELGNAEPALGFNEANPGGGANVGTSIYVLSLQSGWLVGIQNMGIQVDDLGELDTKPVLRTRIEWYAGIALLHPRAASRLRGIKDAAIVA